jgi:hypothetical protein
MNQLLEYLSSFIVILNAIRHIFKKIIKFCNTTRIIKFLKIISTIAFLNQSILLLINYLKYETVNDFSLIKTVWEKDLFSNLAITFCSKSSRFHSENYENSSIRDVFGKMTCTAYAGMKIYS